jgi:hypothetical protein
MSNELQILKARLRIQHDLLDENLAFALAVASEHLIDAGIDVEDSKRISRITNIKCDLAEFIQKRGEKEKIPSHLEYEINNVYFSQKGVE